MILVQPPNADELEALAQKASKMKGKNAKTNAKMNYAMIRQRCATVNNL